MQGWSEVGSATRGSGCRWGGTFRGEALALGGVLAGVLIPILVLVSAHLSVPVSSLPHPFPKASVIPTPPRALSPAQAGYVGGT